MSARWGASQSAGVGPSELEQHGGERASSDPHLSYLDGLDLYGAQDAARLPLPDELHPDAQTHRLIGERFATRVFASGGPFCGEVERRAL